MRVLIAICGLVVLVAVIGQVATNWQRKPGTAKMAPERRVAAEHSSAKVHHVVLGHTAHLAGNIKTVEAELEEVNGRLAAVESEHAGGDASPANSGASTDAFVPTHRDLGDHLTQDLYAGGANQERTTQAESQIREGLLRLQGVRLSSITCGERFCRAEFAGEAGEVPDTTPLHGLPPFEGELFGQPDPENGTLTVYTMAAGVSVEALMTEAFGEDAVQTF